MCSLALFALCLLSQEWTLTLLTAPLALFNVSRYLLRKDHKLYFITRRDYEKVFGKMRAQAIVKSCYYGVAFVVSVLMLIMKILVAARNL